jgi:hypothetical protein
MTTQSKPLPHLAEWGLSSQAVSILSREPSILAELTEARLLPPLPPGYLPSMIEVLFDDVPYIRSTNGVLNFVRNCHPDYQPQFIEYRFDDETAIFQVGNEYVINRIEGIAQIYVLQQLLHQGGDWQWS